jgi:hypothetical protein
VSLAHTALCVATSYRELATYLRMALARLDNKSDWNVVVATSCAMAARKRDKSVALLVAPALAVDLAALVDGKLESEVAGIVDRALSSRTLSFSIIVFKVASEGAEVEAPPALPGAGLPADAAAAITFTRPPPAGHKVLRCARADLLVVHKPAPTGAAAPPAVTDAVAQSTSAAGVTAAVGRALGDVVREPEAAVLAVVGSTLRSVGCDAATDGAFCRHLKAALNASFGGTWHVFVCPAAGPRDLAHAPGFDVCADETPRVRVMERKGDKREADGTPAPPSWSSMKDGADVRLLEVVFPAAPPPPPAPGGGSGVGAGGELAAAPSASNGKTPPAYHLCVYRTTYPQLQALDDGSPPYSEATIKRWFDRNPAPFSFTPVPPPAALADASAPSLWQRMDWWQVGRIALYLVGAAGLVTYYSLTYLSDNHCARGGSAAPVPNAFLTLLLSIVPPPFPPYGGWRHLMPTHASAVAGLLGDAPDLPPATGAGSVSAIGEFDAHATTATHPALSADAPLGLGDSGDLASGLDPSTAARLAAILPPGCQPLDTAWAELRVGQATAALYLGLACLALVSVLRIASKSADKSRVGAIGRFIRNTATAVSHNRRAGGSAKR